MKKINIFSSFAEDYIVYKNKKKLWWPAYFIKNNLENLQAKFKLYSWKKPWKVEIKKDKNSEDVWNIIWVSEIKFPKNKNFSNTIILISTLEKEFDLKNLKNIKNAIIVLDIQWYLRKLWKTKKEIFQNKNYIYINYLKVTESEYKFLENKVKKYFENTKWKWIIITKWWNKVEFTSNWEKTLFQVKSWDFKDTIWAGDTFLSSFCYSLSIDKNVEQSIRFAIKNTFEFLNNKYSNF